MEQDILDELLELMPCRGRKNSGNSTRAAVMHRLDRSGPLSPSELRDALDVTGPRITAILHELEEEGLITRKPDPEDRRSAVISLTPEGRGQVQRHNDLRRDRLQQLAARLGPEDTQALLRILRVIREMDPADTQKHRHGHGRHE